MRKTTRKVTNHTVTIRELTAAGGLQKQTVQLKDADPSELQLFIDKLPSTTKGKSVKYGF